MRSITKTLNKNLQIGFALSMLLMSAGFNRVFAADPSIRWETLSTSHFTLVFDSKQYELARSYSLAAESAWEVLNPLFGDAPTNTVIVISDSSDAANGLANGIPYPTITVFPVLPTNLESIADYGDWPLELITHEYAHILTFHPARGWVKPLRYVFGSIVRPNLLLPRWYLEGLAVELETRFSKFGRLRSPNFLAIPRAMVEQGTLAREDIARINETSMPDWPGGIRPYLIGGILWSEMIKRSDRNLVAQLNDDYSRRFPFFINGPVQSRLGLDYSELLSETYQALEVRARDQFKMIESRGSWQIQSMDHEGHTQFGASISPDGQFMAFISRTHNVDSQLMIAERSAPQESFMKSKSQRVTKGTVMTRVSWLRDSSGLIYDSIGTHDRYYQFADLWHFDRSKNKTKQLTKGLRAREPVVSPDNRFIVFVQNTPGSTRLASLRIDGTDFNVLYEPSVPTRLSGPEFLTNDELLFSKKDKNNLDSFMNLRLSVPQDAGPLVASSEPLPALSDFLPAHHARLTESGILFVSERSGAANLYLADRELTGARAVSNTTTRLLMGEKDEVTGELIVSRLSADGPRLYVVPPSEWNKPLQPPTLSPMLDDRWQPAPEPIARVDVVRESYNPFPYLIPRYWLPYFFLIPEGSYFSASTSSQDPVGRHSYSLLAAYDTLTSRPSLLASYLNHTTDVPITLVGEDSYDYLYSSDLRRHSTGGSITGSFFLPGASENWNAGIGWRHLQTSVEGEPLTRSGASGFIAWKDASRKGLQISPESGGSARLAYFHYFPFSDSLSYQQTEFNGSYFFSRWLPSRHVLAFFANASIAPELDRVLFGKSTIAGDFQTSVAGRGFVMRGYGSGVFIGRNLLVGTMEYRFPLSYPYKGFGTKPFFIQKWHTSLFADVLSLDGIAYDYEAKRFQSQKLGKMFWGTGIEFKADTTLFYHLPMQLIFGLYFGTDKQSNPNGLTPFLGLGM